MQEFQIHFSQEAMQDLRRRIGEAKLPRRWDGRDWKLGMDDDYLPFLLKYWREEYDWY